MSRDVNFWEAVKRIRAKDARFQPEAYMFLMEGLEYTLQKIGKRRHVKANELLDGLCGYARDRFGMLAYEVLSKWGIRTGFDFGLVVFQLVEAGVLSKQDSDRLDDFDIEYDLRKKLEDDYFVG